MKMSEFSSERARSRRALMSMKFWSVQPPVGGTRSDGELVGFSWNAPTAMNQKGNTKASAKTARTTYRAIDGPRPPR